MTGYHEILQVWKVWLFGQHGEELWCRMHVFLALYTVFQLEMMFYSISSLFTFLTVIHSVLDLLTDLDAEPQGILKVIFVLILLDRNL